MKRLNHKNNDTKIIKKQLQQRKKVSTTKKKHIHKIEMKGDNFYY